MKLEEKKEAFLNYVAGGGEITPKRIALLGMTTTSARKWIDIYRTAGEEGIRSIGSRSGINRAVDNGRKEAVSYEEIREVLTKVIEGLSLPSTANVRNAMAEEGFPYTKGGVRQLMLRLGFTKDGKAWKAA